MKTSANPEQRALLSAFDALIARLEIKPKKLRQARALVMEALDDRPAAVPASAPRRGQDKTGATSGRILEILREAKGPMKPAAIVKAAKAPDWQVRLTLKELVADGQILAAGATINKTYTLAKGGAK